MLGPAGGHICFPRPIFYLVYMCVYMYIAQVHCPLRGRCPGFDEALTISSSLKEFLELQHDNLVLDHIVLLAVRRLRIAAGS